MNKQTLKSVSSYGTKLASSIVHIFLGKYKAPISMVFEPIWNIFVKEVSNKNK